MAPEIGEGPFLVYPNDVRPYLIVVRAPGVDQM